MLDNFRCVRRNSYMDLTWKNVIQLSKSIFNTISVFNPHKMPLIWEWTQKFAHINYLAKDISTLHRLIPNSGSQLSRPCSISDWYRWVCVMMYVWYTKTFHRACEQRQIILNLLQVNKWGLRDKNRYKILMINQNMNQMKWIRILKLMLHIRNLNVSGVFLFICRIVSALGFYCYILKIYLIVSILMAKIIENI